MLSVTYGQIRASLRTGDVFLFAGRGAFSLGIRAATRSRWSHVGMAVVLPEYDFVGLWESTKLSDLPDAETGRPRAGVQLAPLSARLDAFDGGVALRRLCGPPPGPEALAGLMRLRRELRGRPYERDALELIRSAWDGPGGRNAGEDLTSLFCSELVAEAYQALGLIDPRFPSNEYTPADFSAARERLPWLAGAGLGPEITVGRG